MQPLVNGDTEATAGGLDPPALLTALEHSPHLHRPFGRNQQPAEAGAGVAAGGCHGNQMSICSQLQHRFRVGLAEGFEWLGGEPAAGRRLAMSATSKVRARKG